MLSRLAINLYNTVRRKDTMTRRKRFRIPGLTFSWKRALGITALKRKIARLTGIPTTKQGRQRKMERTLWQMLFGKRS